MDSKKLKTLLDIGRQMAETRELDPLLESAMCMALEFVSAEYGYIVLLSNNGDLEYRVGQDKNGKRLKEPEGQISHTVFNKVIQSGQSLITGDALDSLNSASVLELQLRSILCAPLITRGKILGAVYVENRSISYLFSADDLELLEYFSAQAAVAIENAILNEYLEAQVEARTAELARANAQLTKLAITDPLTGVFNRRHFFDLAQQELARAQRYGHSLSAIMLDLDHFKQINDQHGHLAGDCVLQTTAKRIRDNIRDIDILGRYGGEEFSVLLPNTALSGAQEIAERVCKIIGSEDVNVNGEEILVTASLGLVSVEELANVRIELLFDQADQALYKAKQTGRNRVVTWSE